MKRFTLPILLSTLFHGALILGVTLWSLYYVEDEGPPILGGGGGGGGVVAIELIEAGNLGKAGGEEVGPKKPSQAKPEPSSKMKVHASLQKKTTKPPRSLHRGDGDESGRDSEGTGEYKPGIVSSGSGGGSGGGHGGGIGKGIGPGRGQGNPILGKIWLKINRSKYYPWHARRRGLEGMPRVTFKITRSGQIEFVKLTKSCGVPELDEAAVETIRRSTPLPHYSKPITVTIRFSLSDDK